MGSPLRVDVLWWHPGALTLHLTQDAAASTCIRPVQLWTPFAGASAPAAPAAAAASPPRLPDHAELGVDGGGGGGGSCGGGSCGTGKTLAAAAAYKPGVALLAGPTAVLRSACGEVAVLTLGQGGDLACDPWLLGDGDHGVGGGSGLPGVLASHPRLPAALFVAGAAGHLHHYSLQ